MRNFILFLLLLVACENTEKSARVALAKHGASGKTDCIGTVANDQNIAFCSNGATLTICVSGEKDCLTFDPSVNQDAHIQPECCTPDNASCKVDQ